MADRVLVAPLREAFLASGESALEVARRLGWERMKRNEGGYRYTGFDDGRVRRDLGLRLSHSNSKGRRYSGYAQMIAYERAVMYAQAIGIDPVDAGL